MAQTAMTPHRHFFTLLCISLISVSWGLPWYSHGTTIAVLWHPLTLDLMLSQTPPLTLFFEPMEANRCGALWRVPWCCHNTSIGLNGDAVEMRWTCQRMLVVGISAAWDQSASWALPAATCVPGDTFEGSGPGGIMSG